MKIYLGSDHGGYELKNNVLSWLIELGHDVNDEGYLEYDESDDYPLVAFNVGKKVVDNDLSVGILFCRSGGGICIASNKVYGVRAVDIYDVKSAVHAKSNNDANIVSLSADWLSVDEAKEIIKAFLNASFDNEERYSRRIQQIKKYEEEGAI